MGLLRIGVPLRAYLWCAIRARQAVEVYVSRGVLDLLSLVKNDAKRSCDAAHPDLPRWSANELADRSLGTTLWSHYKSSR